MASLREGLQHVRHVGIDRIFIAGPNKAWLLKAAQAVLHRFGSNEARRPGVQCEQLCASSASTSGDARSWLKDGELHVVASAYCKGGVDAQRLVHEVREQVKQLGLEMFGRPCAWHLSLTHLCWS